MDVKTMPKTIINPYCSLSQIIRTEKEIEPLYMRCIKTIPFGDVNRLQFGLHELPRLMVYKPLVSQINVATNLESITYFGIYGLPLNGNIKNSYIYKGFLNYRRNLNFKKRLLGGSRANYLTGCRIQRRLNYSIR